MKETRIILQKSYKKRKDILYEMFDRSEPTSIKTMARCGECKKIWKIKGGNFVCSTCGNKIEDNVVNLVIDDYKFYNASTMLFVDAVRNKEGNEEIIATISMMLLSACRFSRKYYPTVGKEAVRLKVRYNLTKKTALMYMRKVRETDDNMWMTFDLNYPFINLTQPTIEYLDKDRVDIELPQELIEDMLELMNISIPQDKKIENIDLYILSWLNRVKDYDKAIWQKSILTILTEKERVAKFLDETEEYKFYKRASSRVKRYLSSGHKPKNYDENTFNALCLASDIERDMIPKEFEKYYYLNPYAIRLVKEHDILFHNRDIRVNAIASAKKDDVSSWGIYNTSHFREEALKAFGNEKRIYKKIEKTGDFISFYDTVKMILKIKKSGHKIKTKGNLYSVHNKAFRMMKYIEAPDVTFNNTRDEESILYVDKKNKEKYEFIFVKTPKELILLGDKTNTCVGSYYNYCIDGDTIIVYIKKANEPVGILELSKTWRSSPALVQAKAPYNRPLPINIQRLVSNFCMDYRLPIDTYDISSKILYEHNKELANIDEATSLNFLEKHRNKATAAFELPF